MDVREKVQHRELALRLKNNALIGALIFKVLRQFIRRETRQLHSREDGVRQQASQSVLTGACM
jgi:hypothetical protein